MQGKGTVARGDAACFVKRPSHGGTQHLICYVKAKIEAESARFERTNNGNERANDMNERTNKRNKRCGLKKSRWLYRFVQKRDVGVFFKAPQGVEPIVSCLGEYICSFAESNTSSSHSRGT